MKAWIGTSGIAAQLGGGQLSTSRHSCFTPGKKEPVPTEQDAGFTPERLDVLKKENLLFLPGFNPQNVQLVA